LSAYAPVVFQQEPAETIIRSSMMANIFLATCYLSWAVAYILIIRRGLADQAYGMPIIAAAANVAWEFIFSFLHPQDPPQSYGNLVWFTLDLLIVFQCVRYGRHEWTTSLSGAQFYAGCALVQAMAFAVVWFVSTRVTNGPRYVAFAQNFMMSALFIAMLLRRGNLSGQSLPIGLAKLLGTGSASVYLVMMGRSSALLNTLFLSILVLDGIYIALVLRLRAAGLHQSA
jgi:hypothetical protein